MNKGKNLIWIYPPNGWVSNFDKTFVYGWSNPKAKLFVNAQKIKIFRNGNFAQTIKLPNRKNVVRLIQILGKKKTILKRKISVGATFTVAQNKCRGDQPVAQNQRAGARPAPTGNNMIIVIDPGHGGKEHGTHSPKGIPEKYFNLQISKMLYKKLQTKFKNVYITRNKDKFVSLKDRVNFAKKRKCNLLISIHHNALPDNEDPMKHHGVGIYYTHDFVKPLARRLLVSISKETKLKKYGIFKRNFALTRPDFCHAVLIECGFLIHPVESEIITQRKIQEKIVGGILNGIISSH